MYPLLLLQNAADVRIQTDRLTFDLPQASRLALIDAGIDRIATARPDVLRIFNEKRKPAMDDERCLYDARMPPDQMKAVVACLQTGNRKEAAMILKKWRIGLLNQLHVCQRQIDCLDYFLQKHKEELL